VEPQVQYAKTSDGVSIAFASMGEGPPLIHMMTPGMAHAQRGWALFPHIFQSLSRAFRFIWYDPRGTGLSDRDAIDFSMEAMVRDLEAVADHAGLESFTILAFLDSVPMAVSYAARFPERVPHLILIDGWTNSSDFFTPAHKVHAALIDSDWALYTETMARVLLGFDDPRLIATAGEHFRTCIEPRAWRAAMEAAGSYDVATLLPAVKAKTLVLHNDDNRFYPVRVGQKLAAGILDARFLAMDDMNYERVAPLVEEFLGTVGKPESVEPGALRTILFTDLVGHTEMMQRLGDAKGRDVLREHERITRDTLKAHGGAEVKTMGDGFMASFGSVTKAMDCAIALQRAFAAHTAAMPEPLQVRVGLNAGEPIEEDGDLFGSTVILASRIAARAGAGEILIPETVRGLLSGKNFLFSDRGEFVPKGFDDAVRLYEVRWRPTVAAGDEEA
jgi:class 3 adenylate cyclase